MTAQPSPLVRPLASALFGWAFGPRGGVIAAGACAIAGAVLVAAEYARPRDGLRVLFEQQQGFYAALGAGATIAIFAVSIALRWLLLRDDPYAEAARDNADGEGDDAHA